MTPDSNSLISTLNAVAKGNLSTQMAQEWIEKNYALKKQKEEIHLDGIKSAFEKLKKLQENLTQNLPPIGFSANIAGIESKLSIFRAVHVSSDSSIVDNYIIGSQWFGVEFVKTAEIKKNKFTAVQLSEFAVICSNFNDINASLARFSNSTIQESRFEQNKISRSIWSDISITESDFTENLITKSNFSGTVINSSRLAKLNFNHVEFRDCEFDKCNIEGLEFENCEFRDCSFNNIHLNLKEPLKISERNIFGKTISNCKTEEEFLNALDALEKN